MDQRAAAGGGVAAGGAGAVGADGGFTLSLGLAGGVQQRHQQGRRCQTHTALHPWRVRGSAARERGCGRSKEAVSTADSQERPATSGHRSLKSERQVRSGVHLI